MSRSQERPATLHSLCPADVPQLTLRKRTGLTTHSTAPWIMTIQAICSPSQHGHNFPPLRERQNQVVSASSACGYLGTAGMGAIPLLGWRQEVVTINHTSSGRWRDLTSPPPPWDEGVGSFQFLSCPPHPKVLQALYWTRANQNPALNFSSVKPHSSLKWTGQMFLHQVPPESEILLALACM